MGIKEIILGKGVRMPDPPSVFIGDDIDPDRISGDGVVLFPGARLSGASTVVSEGCRIGVEGPAVITGCALGKNVSLGSGSFTGAVFLDGASAGPSCHVRPAAIFEEQASCAHAVGLKHTILFPFVTLGSLINFCDVLMAGGTSRKDHSEVGSSYIHFNFTPQQDKATASLLGDVPRGVMLRERPIFLGGQGGLVGPCRVAFGTVIAAGCVWRKDVEEGGKLLTDPGPRRVEVTFPAGMYRSVKRSVLNNLIYMANLAALNRWYRGVRPLFCTDAHSRAVHEALVSALASAFDERAARFLQLAEKMPRSISEYCKSYPDEAEGPVVTRKKELHARAEEAAEELRAGFSAEGAFPEELLTAVSALIREKGPDYTAVIRALSDDEAAAFTSRLSGVVSQTLAAGLAKLPSFA